MRRPGSDTNRPEGNDAVLAEVNIPPSRQLVDRGVGVLQHSVRPHEKERGQMSKAFLVAAFTITGVALTAASAPVPEPKPGYARKDGLSLTVTLDKKAYGPADEIVLRFALKNESDKP